MFSPKSKLKQERLQALLVFQKNLKLKFKKIDILDLALHHRSVINEQKIFLGNNERLEFLGDAVLGMVVASQLYECMYDKPEGELAKIKSVVVSEDTLSKIALNLEINKYLVLGKGEEKTGGRFKKAILADAFEAIIGAFYLDSGLIPVEKFILSHINPEIKLVLQNKHHKDYKTLLQEYVQKQYKTIPKYELIKKTGPDHDKTFWVSVDICNTIYGPKSGKNKKEAEQLVAESVCKTLNIQ